VIVDGQTVSVIVPLDFVCKKIGFEFGHVTDAGFVRTIDLESLVACGEHAEVRVGVPSDRLDVVQHDQHCFHLQCVQTVDEQRIGVRLTQNAQFAVVEIRQYRADAVAGGVPGPMPLLAGDVLLLHQFTRFA